MEVREGIGCKSNIYEAAEYAERAWGLGGLKEARDLMDQLHEEYVAAYGDKPFEP